MMRNYNLRNKVDSDQNSDRPAQKQNLSASPEKNVTARVTVSLDQLRALNLYYDINPSPSPSFFQKIGLRLDLPVDHVQNWFEEEKHRRSLYSTNIFPKLIKDPRSYSTAASFNPLSTTFKPPNFPSKRFDVGHNILRGHFMPPISSLATISSTELEKQQSSDLGDIWLKSPQSIRSGMPLGPFEKRPPFERPFDAFNSPYQTSHSIDYRNPDYFRGQELSFLYNAPGYRGQRKPRGYSRGRSFLNPYGRRSSVKWTEPFDCPPPPNLPKPLKMVEMIQKAIVDLSTSHTKANRLNIKTWIKDNFDISGLRNFQQDFNNGLKEGTEKSLIYEFSNTFRLTSSLLEDHKKASNVFSEDESEATCPIPTPIPESTAERKEALRGFIMGEILSQEPHYSLNKKSIVKKIETMTPTEFKDWALYEPVTSDEEQLDEPLEVAEEKSPKKIKTESDEDSDEDQAPAFSQRTLRKTPTRLLQEQMARLQKNNGGSSQHKRGRQKSYTEKVLKMLVESRRLAVWLKPRGKGGQSRKKVFFATKKAIQWKSLASRRVFPFTKETAEENAFFASCDKHSMAPQEEKIKREEANRRVIEQIERYRCRRAKFFVEHEAIVAPFISKKYLSGARKALKAKKKTKEDLPKLKEPLSEQPVEIAGNLRQYQLAGLNWVVNLYDQGLSGILADEMGLGKTLQTIAFITFLRYTRGVEGPFLIVCPLNVLTNWCNEFSRWSPDLVVVRYHGPERELNRVLRDKLDIGTFDVLVTTFEMVLSAQNVITDRFNYQLIVVDEAHRVKNELAQISESLRQAKSFSKLLLTGTPLQNNLRELWSLLNFLYPEQFVSAGSFDRGFNLIGNKVNEETMLASQRVLKLFMLRRLKSEVANLPPKSETKVLVPMTACQIFWYKRLIAYQGSSMITRRGGQVDKPPMKKLISLIMQLRKCCNHPFLFPNCEPDVNGPHYYERLVSSCGKMQLLDKMLRRLFDEKHRVLIFSQFTSVLDILEEYCKHRKWAHLRLDGNTNRVQRQFDNSRFNQPGSNIFVYLITTRAGGLGINLHTADTVIMYDSDWNPQADLQAQDRAHRIGQTKPVRVFRFITEGTIEERVAQRADKKLFLDAVVTTKSKGKPRTMPSKRSGREILSMLTFGAERVFSAKGKSVSDADVDLLLDGPSSSRRGRKTRSKLELGRVHNAANYDVRAGSLAITRFQGQDVRSQGCAEQNPLERIAAEWAAETGRSLPRFEAVDSEGDDLRQVDVKYRRFFAHESLCHSCKQDGLLLLCESCPRAYHHECLGLDSIPVGSFKCPQHKCEACFRSAHEAGGLLFRCISCPHCSCEDHISFDIVPVDECEALEALGYKKTSSACYIMCSPRCVRAEEERKKEALESDSRGGLDPWAELPGSVRMRLQALLKSDNLCSLSELPGFSTRLSEINSKSTLLQTLHLLFYGDKTHSLLHARLNSWSGIKSSDRTSVAMFYTKVNKELCSWRPGCLLELAKLLGLWTKSEPKMIKGGTSSGRRTKPRPRNISAVDNDVGLACHLAIFFVKPSEFRLFVPHRFISKTFDIDDETEVAEPQVLREEEKKPVEETEVLQKSEEEKVEVREPREVVLLRKTGEKEFQFLGVVERLVSRLRPRSKRKKWREESDLDDFDDLNK